MAVTTSASRPKKYMLRLSVSASASERMAGKQSKAARAASGSLNSDENHGGMRVNL